MNQQKEAMQRLGMSEQEIADVLAADAAIDAGAKLFELTADQKQAEKKARSTGTRTVYNFQKRERKADNDKREIINRLDEALCGIADKMTEITNPEREILFTYNGKNYKVVLSAPRT